MASKGRYATKRFDLAEEPALNRRRNADGESRRPLQRSDLAFHLTPMTGDHCFILTANHFDQSLHKPFGQCGSQAYRGSKCVRCFSGHRENMIGDIAKIHAGTTFRLDNRIVQVWQIVQMNLIAADSSAFCN